MNETVNKNSKPPISPLRKLGGRIWAVWVILLFIVTMLHTHKLQHLQAKSVLIDKTKRPEVMDVSLKSGRKFHAMPDLTNNAEQFGAAWVEWWSHLQPEW